MLGLGRRWVLRGIPALAGCSRSDAGGRMTGRPEPQRDTMETRLAHLATRYPGHLAGVEAGMLIWSDGTRIPTGAEQPARPFDQMLRDATIADQLRQVYEPGPLQHPPPRDHSPGRLRNTAFFLKMYGDCRRGEVTPRQRPVAWMPRTRPQMLPVTTVNDVASRLERVIEELEALPDRLKAYLVPSAGTYQCRAVADTGLLSMHAYGAAIDIAVRSSDYWAWSRSRGDLPYRNRIPPEIVAAFEAEKFIWGGKWYHYDTMHFEYRPELFP